MEITKEKFFELLVEPGHMTSEQLESVFKRVEETKQSPIDLIIEEGYISNENLGRTIADGFGYRFVDPHTENIEIETLSIIPEIVARAQQTIAYKEDATTVYITTTNPDNHAFISLLEKKTGKKIDVAFTTATGIFSALHEYKSNLRGRVKELVDELEENPRDEDGVINLVNLILEYAYDNGTSDIHIEPLHNSSMVRFRIDGVLHEAVSYPKSMHEKIVFRLKIMSRLRTDEHAANQDGRFEYQNDSIKFDVRVSIVPTTDGENVVMRLLTTESSHKTQLAELGYSPKHGVIVRNAISKPHGMILSVGPTGSGKSTTLYTLLQILNRPEVNVMTIEDPVEYDIQHVQQIPVNLKKNVTFATGLRSIVRQDPDIIMVGEIRDSETANIAVNAAMTGHLLLSTLHANDASTTFPRMIDLGVEPFLLASSLNLVISQRLVRRICDKCKESCFLTGEEKLLIEQTTEVHEKFNELSGNKPLDKVIIYRGKKCHDCNDTGYVGRVGIFEIFEINQELQTLIIQKASANIIEAKARSMGMDSMISDGIEKVFAGVTTLEEVIRSTKT